MVTYRSVFVRTRGVRREVRYATTPLARGRSSQKRSTSNGAALPPWVSPTQTQLDDAYEWDGSTIMGADPDEQCEPICMIALRAALVMTVFVFDSRFTGVPRASTCSPRPFRPNLSGLMGNTVDDLCVAVAKLATQIEHASGITIGSILRADTLMDVNEYRPPEGSWKSLNDRATNYPGPVQRAVARDIIAAARFAQADVIQFMPVGGVAIGHIDALVAAVDAQLA